MNNIRATGWLILLALSSSGSGCSSHIPARSDFSAPPPKREIQSNKPKYGPEIILLAASHEYIQESPAPHYWEISPYYTAQETDSGCSLASATMIINAARSGKILSADDELATQNGLLKRLQRREWKRALENNGPGVNLDQFRSLLASGLKAYGVERFTIEAVHLSEPSETSRSRLVQKLDEFENTRKAFIVANFIQGVYTGDAQVGHFAPIGAYDSKRQRVLIMDPDRQWYEPYWVSIDTFLKGMATFDQDSGNSRGYLLIRVLN